MLSITKEGLEYLQLHRDERSLRKNILWALTGEQDAYSFLDVVTNVQSAFEEYKYNEIKVFARHTANLVKEGLIKYDHEQ